MLLPWLVPTMAQPSWLPFLVSVAFLASTAHTSPLPHPFSKQNSSIEKRCDNPCGWENRLCCGSNQHCYVDSNNQAQCGNGVPDANGGYWKTLTSVWTETNFATYTSTYSMYVPTSAPVPRATGAGLDCKFELNESECGSICCASNQYCYKSDECRLVGDGLTTGVATATATAPIVIVTTSSLVTASGSTFTRTATITPTSTVSILPPLPTGVNPDGTPIENQGGGGLSGGAIAGIVLGVLAGLALLGLLCFCCLFRGLLGAIKRLFGGGKADASDRSSSSSSSSSSSHGVGGGPSKPEGNAAKKTLFAGLLAGLLVFLAKRRKGKQVQRPPSVTVTTTSYTRESSYTGTTPSDISTDDYMSRYTGRPPESRYTTRPSRRPEDLRYPPDAYRRNGDRRRPASYRSSTYSRSRRSAYSRRRDYPPES